jgi:hypothetical protein
VPLFLWDSSLIYVFYHVFRSSKNYLTCTRHKQYPHHLEFTRYCRETKWRAVDTVKCYWDCYFWGDGSSVPYRNLHGCDLNRLGASNLSRANKVVKFLLEVGERPQNYCPANLQESDACFNACFECMCGVLKLSVRACDLNVLTAYNCIQAFQK